jgi:hypothetical protein
LLDTRHRYRASLSAGRVIRPAARGIPHLGIWRLLAHRFYGDRERHSVLLASAIIGLYDRRGDQVSIDDVERIGI